jgi:hypothetical protein
MTNSRNSFTSTLAELSLFLPVEAEAQIYSEQALLSVALLRQEQAPRPLAPLLLQPALPLARLPLFSPPLPQPFSLPLLGSYFS